jgi:hypothetical protein
MKTKLIPTLLLSFLMLNLTSCGDIIEQLMNYQPNKPPVIGGVTSSLVEGTPLVPDMKIDLTIDAHDPEDETVTYSFQSDDGAIKNLTTTPTGCTLEFFTDGSIEPGAAVILKITATDPRKAKSSVEYNVGLGKMGPTVTVDGNFPEMIEMDESITGTLSADSDGYYQIRIIDDVNEEVKFNEDESAFIYYKDTQKEFTIYGPGFANEFTPQLMIPAKSPDKIAIIVKDTLGLEGYAEYAVSVNGPDYVDEEDPYVSIISHAYGDRVFGINTITAEALDNYSVSKVEFYFDNRLIGIDSTAPYTLTYDFSLNTIGEYPLKAVVYDELGNSSYHVIPNINVESLLFEDDFEGDLPYDHGQVRYWNNWKIHDASLTLTGTSMKSADDIDEGITLNNTPSDNCWAAASRSLEVYDNSKFPLRIECTMYNLRSEQCSVGIGYGHNNELPIFGVVNPVNGIYCRNGYVLGKGYKWFIGDASGDLTSVTFPLTNGGKYKIKMEIYLTLIKFKCWDISDSEPVDWTLEVDKGSELSVMGNTFLFFSRADSTGATTRPVTFDNLIIRRF